MKLNAARTSLWTLLVASLLISGARGSPATEQPAKYDLGIADQPLGSALQDLAKQSGVQIIFFSQITEDIRSPAIKGQYTLTAALEILLARTRLAFREINPKTIEILSRAADDSLPAAAGAAKNSKIKKPAGPPTLRHEQPTAETSDSLNEIMVTGTAEGLVATRSKTPLREIPQTVSLISQEQMRQQNDTDLADVLKNAVGITVVQNNSLSNSYISRGFTVTTFHLDGGAALNSFSNTPIYGTPDLGEYDHVEVLRGSDALFGGIGNPGATVNMIRKRPLASNEVGFSAYAGSWSNYRAEADITGPLGFDGGLRGRFDVVFGDRNYFFKRASLEREKVFGVVEYDLTPRTLVTVGGSYQWENSLPLIGGVPFYADGSDAHLPRSTAFAFNWSRYDTRTRELYAQLKQSFGARWKLQLNATSLDASAAYGYGGFDSPIDPITKALPILPSALFSPSPNQQDQFAFDGTLTGGFELFGRRVDVAVGFDYTHFAGDIAIQEAATFGSTVSNVFAYDPAAYPNPPIPMPGVYRSLPTTNQGGVFASTRLYLTDALSFTGGARISSNRESNNLSVSLAGFTSSFTQAIKDDHKATPFVGVTYDVSEHYSLYASYADIYQTNGAAQEVDGAFVPPADGVDRELGIKGSWRSGALNGLFVLYDIDQRGVAAVDPGVSSRQRQSFALCCYLPDGSNRSKGVEAELSGTLAPGWLIGAGYTYNSNRAVAVGDLSSVTPRHLLKLWSSTQLPGDLGRWSIGGSLQAQSSMYAEGLDCARPNSAGGCGPQPLQVVREVQGSFAVIDLRAGYQIDAHWRTALSINNVFDRSYYQTIGTPLNGSWYGAPRGFVLRIDGKY